MFSLIFRMQWLNYDCCRIANWYQRKNEGDKAIIPSYLTACQNCLFFCHFALIFCHVLLLQKHLGKNENEKLDLHLCDLVIALIVIGIIVLTLYKATNHVFLWWIVKLHLQLFEHFFFFWLLTQTFFL